MKLRKDIKDKLAAYDKSHGTAFAPILTEKLSPPRSSDYQAGVIHGILLVLSQQNVISNYDAMDILDEYRDTQKIA